MEDLNMALPLAPRGAKGFNWPTLLGKNLWRLIKTTRGGKSPGLPVTLRWIHSTAFLSSCCHTEFRIILDSMEPQNVQIAPEIIQAITREAAARGLSVDEYLRQALGVMNGTPAPDSQTLARPFYETATVEEWVREFTKWAESHGPNTPGLTREDVSRERMYED